jgi:hypothetical protein
MTARRSTKHERYHGSATIRVRPSGGLDISIPLDEGCCITAVVEAGSCSREENYRKSWDSTNAKRGTLRREAG